jgi:hypothetical protein
VGSITQIVDSQLVFQNPGSLNAVKRNSVIGSLGVTNRQPITGQSANPSLAEVKQQILGNFAAQDRVVTEQDYKAFVYTMPGSFGAVKRCSIYRDSDAFRRNLNLYVISLDSNGYLAATDSQTKQNLKLWLGRSKMINDTIDIIDAKVVNVQLKYTIITYSSNNSVDLQSRTLLALKNRYQEKMEIGQNFDLEEVTRILLQVPGVSAVRNVRLENVIGGGYSNISYDVASNVDAQNRFVEVPKNVILEIKYLNEDIIGTIR